MVSLLHYWCIPKWSPLPPPPLPSLLVVVTHNKLTRKESECLSSYRFHHCVCFCCILHLTTTTTACQRETIQKCVYGVWCIIVWYDAHHIENRSQSRVSCRVSPVVGRSCTHIFTLCLLSSYTHTHTHTYALNRYRTTMAAHALSETFACLR